MKYSNNKGLAAIAVIAIVIILLGSWIASGQNSGDDGEDVYVHMDQPYDIVVKENASTGYLWVVTQSDVPYLEDYVVDISAPVLPGAESTKIYTLCPNGPGDYVFKAEKVRGSDVVDRVSINLHVDDVYALYLDGSIKTIKQSTNVSTGYHWEYENTDGINVFAIYVEPESEFVGTEGTMKFFITGKTEGIQTLVLNNVSPGGNIEETLVYTFDVMKSNPYSNLKIN